MKTTLFIFSLLIVSLTPALAQNKNGDIDKAKKHLVTLLDHLLEKGDSDAEKYLNAIRSDFPDDFTFRRIARRVAEMKEKARAAANNKRKRLLSIREVETDQASYFEREIVINGAMSLSSYYNWGYRNAKGTHYAFEIKDRTGRWLMAYVRKDTGFGQGTRKMVLDLGDNLSGAYTVKILRRRFQTGASEIFAELVGTAPPIK